MAYSIAITTIGNVDGVLAPMVQRDVSGNGAVTIKGTQTDETTSIQYRIVDYTTGLIGVSGHSTWQTLVETPGASWQATISAIPSSEHAVLDDWFKIEVRLADSTGTTDVSGSFGVGAFVALLGQSNARLLTYRDLTEVGETASTIPTFGSGAPAVVQYRKEDSAFSALSGGTTAVAEDGIIKYASRFVTAERVPVCFISYAVGSTGLDENLYPDGSSWLDLTPGQGPGVPWSTDALYTDFLAALAICGGCEFVVWWQGEYDSDFYQTTDYNFTYSGYLVDPPTTEDKYYTNLTTLISWLRSDISATVGIAICTLGRTTGLFTQTDYPLIDTWQSIRNAQTKIASEDVNIFRIDTQEYGLLAADGIHVDLPGKKSIGDRLGYVHLTYLDSVSYPYIPPTITDFMATSATTTSVTVSSSNLTPSSGFDGFQVFDSKGVEATISSVSYSGTTVLLTHASVEVDRIVTYLSGTDGAGTGTTAPTLLKENNALGLPLEWNANIQHKVIWRLETGGKFYNTYRGKRFWNDQVLNETSASYSKTEKAKLLGIESGATADMSAAEIKVAYDSNADTNAFTDTEKSNLSAMRGTGTINALGQGDTPVFTNANITTKLDIGATSGTADFNIVKADATASSTIYSTGQGAGTYAETRVATDYNNVAFAAFPNTYTVSPYLSGNGLIGCFGGKLISVAYRNGDDLEFHTNLEAFAYNMSASTKRLWITSATGAVNTQGDLNVGGAVTAVNFSGVGTGLTGTAASLSIGGNAATSGTATNATNIAVASTGGESTIYRVLMALGAGNIPTKSTANLTYNNSTQVLKAQGVSTGTGGSVGLVPSSGGTVNLKAATDATASNLYFKPTTSGIIAEFGADFKINQDVSTTGTPTFAGLTIGTNVIGSNFGRYTMSANQTGVTGATWPVPTILFDTTGISTSNITLSSGVFTFVNAGTYQITVSARVLDTSSVADIYYLIPILTGTTTYDSGEIEPSVNVAAGGQGSVYGSTIITVSAGATILFGFYRGTANNFTVEYKNTAVSIIRMA